MTPHLNDSMPDFLALIEDRPADEVEFALAVAAAVAHHMDRHKETDMSHWPIRFTRAQTPDNRWANQSALESMHAAQAAETAERADRAAAKAAAKAEKKGR